MAGLLDGLNDFGNSNGMQGLLAWSQSPEASAMIQGLLRQASPSMTEPRSLTAGIANGMGLADEAHNLAAKRALEQQRFGLDQQRVGMEGTRLGFEKQRLGREMDAYEQQKTQRKMLQQLFGIQAPAQGSGGILSAPPSVTPSGEPQPLTSEPQPPLSGGSGSEKVSGDVGYDDLSNQSPTILPPTPPPQQETPPPSAASQPIQNNYVTLGNGLKVRADQYKKAQLLYAMGDQKGAMRSLVNDHAQNLTGLAQEYASLQILGDKYGTGSEIYKGAKSEIDQRRDSAKQLMEYRQKLAGVADKRVSTHLGKTQSEIEDIKAGYLPSTGRTQEVESPEAQQALLDTYQLAKQKETTDVDTRRRSLFASNIDKTIARIDPTSLMQYGGIGGEVAKRGQESLATIGQESPEYRQYSKSLQDAKLLAHQVRQFYGESIQPVMNEKIEKLVNPADWKTNPELAKQNYNELVGLLHNETATFRGGLRNVKEFEDRGQNNPTTNKAASNGGAIPVYRGGKKYLIPPSEVKSAIAAGGSLRE